MTQRIFYGWWVVFACFIIAFYVASVVFYGFTAFFEPLINEFGWSYTQVSFASSLRGLEMGILSPVVGFLVDRYGSRSLLFIGTLMVGLGLILLGMTQSLLMFYGAFIVISFGAGGATSVVTQTAVANWFHRKAGLALGIMASGFGASGLMIPLIVWLVDAFGWRSAVSGLGVAMWLIGLPLALIVCDRPEDCGLLPDGDQKPVHDETDIQETALSEDISFLDAFRDRAFIYLTIAEGIRMMVLTTVVIHIMPYLGSIGISRYTAGVLAAAIPILSITGRFGFGWLSDTIDKRYISSLSFTMMTIGMVIFSVARSPLSFCIFLLLFSPGHGGGVVMRAAMVREYYGRAIFGKMVGIIMGVSSIGGIIGPTLAGWIYDTTGSYFGVWVASSVAVAASVIFILLIPARTVTDKQSTP